MASEASRRNENLTQIEWIIPLAFVLIAAYVVWYCPKYIIVFGGASDALKLRFDQAGVLDFVILALIPTLGVIGVRTAKRSPMEFETITGFDRISLFLGRVTMFLIALIVLVMFYEVTARYVFSSPTLWANELSLWIASFVFLFAGLYAMQQRSHIRIFLLYDIMPLWVRKLCDMVSTLLICLFAFILVWGGFNDAYNRFFRWETLGTVFDPPIPATLSPLMLLFMCLVAIQSVSNLIIDWNRPPDSHTAADEAEEIKSQLKSRSSGD